MCEKSHKLWEYYSERAMTEFLSSFCCPLKTYRLIFLFFYFFEQIWGSKFHFQVKMSQISPLDPHICPKNKILVNSCNPLLDDNTMVRYTQFYQFLCKILLVNKFFPNRRLKKRLFHLVGKSLYICHVTSMPSHFKTQKDFSIL